MDLKACERCRGHKDIHLNANLGGCAKVIWCDTNFMIIPKDYSFEQMLQQIDLLDWSKLEEFNTFSLIISILHRFPNLDRELSKKIEYFNEEVHELYDLDNLFRLNVNPNLNYNWWGGACNGYYTITLNDTIISSGDYSTRYYSLYDATEAVEAVKKYGGYTAKKVLSNVEYKRAHFL